MPTQDEIVAALDEHGRFVDPSVGFVDCTSFAIMRRLGIQRAFTFDRRHFQAAGFAVVP